ncbi:MAG: hypothetical protein ABJB16_02460, partial [Saprospiraceae bacterium]
TDTNSGRDRFGFVLYSMQMDDWDYNNLSLVNITKTVSNIRYPLSFAPFKNTDTCIPLSSVNHTYIDAYISTISYIIFTS